MKSNIQLESDIENAIKWEPLLHAADIGVTAKDGAVSLTGAVDSYLEKLEVINAAQNVIGVKDLVEDIEVRLPSSWKKNDAGIVKEAIAAMNSNWAIPQDKVDNITVKVENGWVTLEGELPWYYQKEAAKSSLNHLKGVLGIVNNIKIKSEVLNAIEKKDVEDAIGRSFSGDDCDVHVSVSDITVTLTGTVSSWNQKEKVGRIAWNTPGIWIVKNELEVD